MREERMTIAGIIQQENGLESLANRFKRQSESNLPVKQGGRRGQFVDNTPPEFFQKIAAELTPEEKARLDVTMKMGAYHGPEIGAPFRRLNGKPFPQVDGYFRFDRILKGDDFNADSKAAKMKENQSILAGDWANKKQFTASVNKSRTIERVNSKKGLWIRGIRDIEKDMIDFASNYAGYSEWANDMAKVIFDPDMVDSIRNKHGQEAVESFQNSLRAQIGYRAPTNFLENFALRVKNRSILGALGFNLPNTILNRMLTVRAAAFGVDLGSLGEATARMIANPKAVREYWYNNSRYFRELAEQGTMPEFAQAAEGGTRVGRAMKKAAMAPERLAFTRASINEAEGMRIQAMKEMQAGHLSPLTQDALGIYDDKAIPSNELEREALGVKAGEYIAKRTHAGPGLMYQNFLSTTHGTLGKIVTTLYSEKSAMYQMGSRILNSGGKVGWKFARFIGVGVLGEAIVKAATSAGFQAGKDALLQAITGQSPYAPTAPGQKPRQPKSLLVYGAEALAQSVASFLPGAGEAEYGAERLLESAQRDTSDIAKQFNATGVVGEPLVRLAMLATTFKDYVTAKPGKAQTDATYKMIKAWLAMSSYFTAVHATTTNYATDIAKGVLEKPQQEPRMP